MNGGCRKLLSGGVFGAALAFVLTASSLAGPTSGPNMTEFIRETQKRGELPGRLTVIWWLPEDFWSLSLKKGSALGEEQQEAFLKAVRPYLIIAAVDAKIGPLGGSEFLDQDALRAGIKIVDRKGRSYPPLPDDQLTADIKNLSALMKSMLGNMLGPMGQGMSFFFFPATAPDGSTIAAASREGTFSVELGEQTFTWRLPLGSLLPPRMCPVDGERMSGAWKYCPIHGKPLEDADKPAQEPSPAPR